MRTTIYKVGYIIPPCTPAPALDPGLAVVGILPVPVMKPKDQVNPTEQIAKQRAKSKTILMH